MTKKNTVSSPKKHVLIVDDEMYITITLSNVLETLGDAYVIDTANTSTEVLERVKRTAYDLIITDYRMPGMDGINLAQAVQEISPQTHIILMTAYGNSALAEKAEALRLDGYLDKPFTVDQIRDMVTDTLNEEGESPRILIMEDNSDLNRLYKRALARRGYDVDTASTMEAARALLAQQQYAVFLCDIHIGRERGTDLLREFAQKLQENGTQTVMVSGDASFRADVEDMGVDFYLEKPIALDTLTTLISRLTAHL